MEIANKAKEAEVKIEIDDVTMKLGDDVTVHTAGNGDETCDVYFETY